jgi:flagellar protein FlbD
MIRLTRLNREQFYLNPDLIQEMESTPDTVLTLTSGTRLVVMERPDTIIAEVVEFRRRFSGLLKQAEPSPGGAGSGA